MQTPLYCAECTNIAWIISSSAYV